MDKLALWYGWGNWRENLSLNNVEDILMRGRGTNLKIGEETWREVPCPLPPQVSWSPQVPRGLRNGALVHH